jgi:hypothetical protein
VLYEYLRCLTFVGHLRILILSGGHSYQCVCVLHAILLPSGHLTLSTIAPYRNCPIRKVFIFSDSQSGLKRIYNLIIRSGQSLIQKLINDLLWIINKFQITVQFEWVPGHLGIRDNEIAD